MDLLLGGQSRRITKWTGSQRSPIFGFISIYAYTLCHRTIIFDVVTHVVQGRVSWGQPRLLSQESGVLGLRNFEGFHVFMPTPFNAERLNSAW